MGSANSLVEQIMRKCMISDGNKKEIISRFQNRVVWEGVSNSMAKEILSLSDRQFASRFGYFLRRGCQFDHARTKIIIAKPFSLAHHTSNTMTQWNKEFKVGKHKFSVWPASQADKLRKIVMARFRPVNFAGGAKGVSGVDKLYKLVLLEKRGEIIRLGPEFLLGFLTDWLVNDKASALEWLHEKKGVERMDFPSQIFATDRGEPISLSLKRNSSGQWEESCELIAHEVANNCFSACYQLGRK